MKQFQFSIARIYHSLYFSVAFKSIDFGVDKARGQWKKEDPISKTRQERGPNILQDITRLF
jgi:hypothetical protein